MCLFHAVFLRPPTVNNTPRVHTANTRKTCSPQGWVQWTQIMICDVLCNGLSGFSSVSRLLTQRATCNHKYRLHSALRFTDLLKLPRKSNTYKITTLKSYVHKKICPPFLLLAPILANCKALLPSFNFFKLIYFTQIYIKKKDLCKHITTFPLYVWVIQSKR